jgi:polysaccharide export outer membrane protein
MPPGGLNLAQAIASAELRDIGFDFRHIRIIRSLSTTRGELIVIDYDRVLRGEALPIQLSEGDIVYVPKSPFGNWNDAIAEMLPSLQMVSAVLQPFVSMKFLSQ